MNRFRDLDFIFKMYEQKRLVEICSTGADREGTSECGIIITTDKRMLTYSINNVRYGNAKYDVNIDYDKMVDDKKFDKINNFLNKKIIGKHFEDIMIFDMSFEIIGNGFKVENHRNLYDELRKIIEK